MEAISRKNKKWLIIRIIFILITPAIIVLYFFYPKNINFTFSPTNNSATISGYTSQINNFDEEMARFNFVNIQFVKYNLYLQQNIQVWDVEKNVIIPGTLIYNDLSGNQQQAEVSSTIKIGDNLDEDKITDFINQFGNEVQITFPVSARTIPPHGSMEFIDHAYILIIACPTVGSYIYLYIFTIAALIGLIILIKEALSFITKGLKYFGG